jgi:LysM repeat protein
MVMRISGAGYAAAALLVLSLLAGCERAAPDIVIVDQLATGTPANTPAGGPLLIPSPTPQPTVIPRPAATVSVNVGSTPVAQVPLPPESFKYAVQPGDTLASIAARFNTTVDVIRALNNIQGDLIVVGQVLNIPGSQPVASNPTTAPPPPPPTRTPTPRPVARRVTYVVRPGDHLYRIGLRFGVSWQAIARANGLADADMIRVGQVLIIPTDD